MSCQVSSEWVKTKSDEVAIDQGAYFDISYAERCRDFLYKFCRQSIGQWDGKPLELMPFQWTDIVAPLYGWRNADSTRRFRSVGIWLPKNNGKSTICSSISLFHLVADNEPGAQVVNLATTVDQANIVFRGAADMVAQSPALEKLLWVRKNIKTIEYEKTRSTLKVMSGERGGGKRGYAISLLIVDELGEFVSRELWDTMRNNVAKRKNSLLISISTAGYKTASIAKEQFDYACDIRDSKKIDTAFLPVVYAAKPDQPWDSMETFKKCNPAYGITIEPRQIEELLTEARNEPRKEAAYKVERLNLFSGSASQWISTQKWTKCGADYQESDFYNADAWVAIDYGFKHDLCAACLLVEREGLHYLFPRFFIPRKCAEEKQEKDHVPYLTWAKQKNTNLYLTDGDVVDPKFVRQVLQDDSTKFNFLGVGYDPSRGMEETRQICEEEYGWTMIAVTQSASKLGQHASTFERLILSNKLRHPKNPILDWCCENASAKETPHGLYVFKGKQETQRIDGIIAACICLAVRQRCHKSSSKV